MRKHTIRGWAEYLGDSQFRYHWPCGHTRVEQLKAMRKPVGEAGCRVFARWWSKENGGVNLPPCKTCKRKS